MARVGEVAQIVAVGMSGEPRDIGTVCEARRLAAAQHQKAEAIGLRNLVERFAQFRRDGGRQGIGLTVRAVEYHGRDIVVEMQHSQVLALEEHRHAGPVRLRTRYPINSGTGRWLPTRYCGRPARSMNCVAATSIPRR